VIPKACTLSPEGRVRQRDRFEEVRGDILDIDRTPTALTIRFAPGADERLLGELIAAERECCSFLEIEYSERVLRIASDEPHDLDPFTELLR
jgi:hypothetical protein